jgi:hypothetical protein
MAQNAVKNISGDKQKIGAYCELDDLTDQFDQAVEEKDTKKAAELSQKGEELLRKLGPEFAALADGMQSVDLSSQDVREIGSWFGLSRCRLAVQLPTKFELVINLKIAKSLGFDAGTSTCHCGLGDRIAPVSAAAQNVCLWGTKRTLTRCRAMSAFDPKRKSSVRFCCDPQL